MRIAPPAAPPVVATQASPTIIAAEARSALSEPTTSFSPSPTCLAALSKPTQTETGTECPQVSATRKKVVVFTVSAGGGHLAAAEAIAKALEGQHNVEVVRPVEAGAREYNEMMGWGWHGPLNLVGALQDVAEQTLVPITTSAAMEAALDSHRPDLLISVLPFANGVAWRAAKARGVPMLVVPTDLGVDHYVKSIQDIDANLKVVLPFDTDGLRAAVGQRFAPHNLVPLGYPVRPEFGEAWTDDWRASALLECLGVAPADKLVLTMMGAGGGSAVTMLEDSRALLDGLQGRADTVHIVCLCGKNAVVRDGLTKLARQGARGNVLLHALGFVDAATVATLMRRGSVIITKTGGGTVNEALAVRLPLLLRAGEEQLWWEAKNSDFVTQSGLGEWTQGGAQLVGQVSVALQKKRPTLEACPARAFGRNLLDFIATTFKPRGPVPALPRRPRVLILSSDAGAGHAAAGQAIGSTLEAECDVLVEKPFDFRVALPLLGALQGVDVYNAVQAHGPTVAMNLLGGLQRLAAPFGDMLHGSALEALMAQHAPDLVISVVPMGHGTAYKVARARGIPMMVVPTDLEFPHFADQIPADAVDFKLALPYPDMRIQAPHLPESAFAVTGYPVRAEFLATLNAPAGSCPAQGLPARLGIDASDHVAMIMMGGAGIGADQVVAHVETLVDTLEDTLPAGQHAHVVCVCGRNAALARRLAAAAQRSIDRPVRAHALGLCDAAEVATLMRVAGVLITKPGGATVNEALAARLPQLYDRSIGSPLWESANADYAVAQGLGAWVEPGAMAEAVAKVWREGRPPPIPASPATMFPQRLQTVVKQLLRHTARS